jgi:steroid 5-alpha reductase family enzyme
MNAAWPLPDERKLRPRSGILASSRARVVQAACVLTASGAPKAKAKDVMHLFFKLMGGPATFPWRQLCLALVICLSVSALGFRRVEYFVSLGYASSIAAQALVFGALYAATLGGWVFLQVALLVAYGIRLGSFLILRGRSASFKGERAASAERGSHLNALSKVGIWISVAVLYVVMFAPALLTMSAQARGLALPSVFPGSVIMACGLALEATSDWQKSRFKATAPSQFCSHGLYRIVRSPNYLGEMIFWLGTWLSGLSAYQTPLAWLMSLAGFITIQLIMLGSARRLELKQAERYGLEAAYQKFARTVPVLFPWVPLYSLKRLKVYLG